jgi:creatinine amidohydrolase
MIHGESAPWPQAAAALDGGIAILPFGAFEQHGHHLPLSTDTIVAEHVARELAARLDAVLLPAIGYGETWNNAGYPATLSLSPATVTAIALDLARALTFSRARAFIIVNGDWGNRAPLAEAARRAELPTLVLDYPGMDDAAAEVRDSAQAAPGLSLDHAGEIETSILLQIAPKLVDPDRYTTGYPDFPADFGTRPMQLHPFSESGVFGDPSLASATKGTAILAATIDESERVARAFVDGIA